jgi:starch phosphorylase
MKAIMNGVIQVTTLDGWVVEADQMNIGRIFGYKNKEGNLGNELDLHMREDAKELYRVLEELVGLYYKTNGKVEPDFSTPWVDMMISCIAASSRFNTYRMLDEYKQKIWGFTGSTGREAQTLSGVQPDS